jgi:hypothetical protein
MIVAKTKLEYKCQNPECGIEAKMFVNDNIGGQIIVDCQNPSCGWRYGVGADQQLGFIRNMHAPLATAAAA